MRYVKYVGLSHQRLITAADWRTVGITGDTVVWNAANGFAVPLDQFSDDQIRKAIEGDPHLIITGEDEDFEPTPIPTDMTPAQHVQAVENPVDIIALANGHQNVSRDDSGASKVVSPGSPDGDVPRGDAEGSADEADQAAETRSR